jgi:hypothetical protein
MSSQPHGVVMLGLPSSGKSTYLGGLFHSLKDSGADGLRLQGLPDERDYLIELEKAWLALEPLERSRHHGPKHVELPLLLGEPDDARPLRLEIPDVVGESYEAAWEYGQWEQSLQALLRTARGLLLFARANAVVAPELIEIHPSKGESSGERSPWEPADSPTQAKLCDLLEQVGEMRREAFPAIAVVVSAWDSVADLGLAPADWLQWQLPLLAQWLTSHKPTLTQRTFGVSAQGGDLENEQVREQVAIHAGERPVPLNGDKLTAPLRWLLDHA